MRLCCPSRNAASLECSATRHEPYEAGTLQWRCQCPGKSWRTSIRDIASHGICEYESSCRRMRRCCTLRNTKSKERRRAWKVRYTPKRLCCGAQSTPTECIHSEWIFQCGIVRRIFSAQGSPRNFRVSETTCGTRYPPSGCTSRHCAVREPPRPRSRDRGDGRESWNTANAADP